MSTGEVGLSVMAAVDEFVQQLRRRQIEGSTATGKRTAEILRLLVTKSRRPTPEGMLEDVCMVGMRMQAAKPLGATLAGPAASQHFPLSLKTLYQSLVSIGRTSVSSSAEPPSTHAQAHPPVKRA